MYSCSRDLRPVKYEVVLAHRVFRHAGIYVIYLFGIQKSTPAEYTINKTVVIYLPQHIPQQIHIK